MWPRPSRRLCSRATLPTIGCILHRSDTTLSPHPRSSSAAIRRRHMGMREQVPGRAAGPSPHTAIMNSVGWPTQAQRHVRAPQYTDTTLNPTTHYTTPLSIGWYKAPLTMRSVSGCFRNLACHIGFATRHATAARVDASRSQIGIGAGSGDTAPPRRGGAGNKRGGAPPSHTLPLKRRWS